MIRTKSQIGYRLDDQGAWLDARHNQSKQNAPYKKQKALELLSKLCNKYKDNEELYSELSTIMTITRNI